VPGPNALGVSPARLRLRPTPADPGRPRPTPTRPTPPGPEPTGGGWRTLTDLWGRRRRCGASSSSWRV